VLAHLILLVTLDSRIGTRLRRAQQHKPRGQIFRVVGFRRALIELPFADQPSGASEAPSVVAYRGEIQPVPRSRIPDKFIPVDQDFPWAVWRFQDNSMVRRIHCWEV
jgi:hypothetical protein